MLKDATLLLEHAIRAEERLKKYSQRAIDDLTSIGIDYRLEVITHPSFYANNTKLEGHYPVKNKYTLDEFDIIRRFYEQMPSESQAIKIIEEQVKALDLGEDVNYTIGFGGFIKYLASGLEITLEDKLRCTISSPHTVFYLKNGAPTHSSVELKPEVQSDGKYVWSARLFDSKDSVLAKLELAKQGYLIIAVRDMKSAEELGKRLMGSENGVMAYRVLSVFDIREYKNDSLEDVVPTIMTRLSLTWGHKLSDVNTLAQTRLIERAEKKEK